MSHNSQSSAGETGAPPDSAQTATSGTGAPTRDAITQELVNQVADKVYVMLLAELTIEKERRRLPNRRPFRS